MFREAIMADRRRTFIAFAYAILLSVVGAGALAQEHHGRPAEHHPPGQEQGQPGTGGRPEQGGPGVLSLLPADSVTDHSVNLSGGGKLDYTATAGTFSLFNLSGERSAAIFYTAYVAKSADPATRPVTFLFNGGPGASAAFLNLGVVGPRLAQFGDDNRNGAKVRLVDNPDTWLAFTDLVLIDPVGTGWSRAAKPGGDEDFWSVNADAASMAKVIALYVAKNNRLSSPKFIVGESYGGFRAAKVARVLPEQQGISINGIIMLSPMLEGAFQFGGDRFALGAALQLPSLAAAEMESKGTFSQQALAQAEHFALTDYLTTLAGPPLQGDAAKNFYKHVASLTGLPEDVLARQRGFIDDAYVKDLHLNDKKIVSHYDATFAVDDPNPESPVARAPDPILDGLVRSYGSAFAAYARNELGYKTEMTYNLLDDEIAGRWKWGSGHGEPSATEDLRVLLELTPSFHLMIAHGYSDMVTPFSVTRYVLDHLPPEETAGRVHLRLYRGGHMFYLDPDSRKAFTADARTMYASP
jgi:carboxypeptidase C (cathepsin A)